ncbi:hypothetical protein ACM01_15445 [Streptomyces viridochromogenes]|uniref:Uncharacterized protein n=1 Tax=Streptomyces viridochromogenes TaxID=1938 RepID=A0A0J7ZFU9_STRVR|nr:hypothetical protein [Streptomyces viridochromogenes]KMS74287.1 hypothetical protein ACM01_15445 [Streptomyces viridochromogenes]
MTSPILTIDTPAGPVRATAGPREDDAVVFELGGAMRGSVHVTGTTDPHRWDQFTAIRACLGPVNAFKTTAPDDALPRLARSRTGYRGSLTLYRDNIDRPEVSVHPLLSAADHPPSEKTAAVLTAVLRGCAEHVEQRADLPAILEASRQRDTPGLLRFLTWSASYHQDEAARLEREACAAHPARRAAVAAWWTVAQWFLASPHPVLLLMLADLPYSVLPNSLARTVDVKQWWAPYCVDAAADERERARRAQAEADSLRAQQHRRPRGRRPALVGTP